MERTVRRFGRARGLSLGLRMAEVTLAFVYRGGWLAAIALRLGMHGTLRTRQHTVHLSERSTTAPPLRVAFASDFHAGPLDASNADRAGVYTQAET